jgi:phage-related baseplate assembly protein
MSDPVLFAEKDPTAVLAAALELYRVTTGVALAAADPRRLHLQTVLLLLSQQRQRIDFAGKQSLLRYVDAGMPIASAVFIQALAELWGEVPLPAEPSTCTERFTGDVGAPIPTGSRVTDGTSQWAVVGGPYTIPPGNTIDLQVQCTVAGAVSNGVAPGQIATMVDALAGVSSVTNTTTTISGRDIESTEAFRTRLRSVPENRSTCGPRLAYEQAALDASASVADAVALGADDASEMAGTLPTSGEVHVIITQGTRDSDGTLISVVPDPDANLISTVDSALSAEDVRPLTDFVTVKAPVWANLDIELVYYISKSRADSASTIQAAVEDAYAAYKLWQQQIGRDINPSELITRLVNAGAKRVVIGGAGPVFTVLKRDECSRLFYEDVLYGGIEDD